MIDKNKLYGLARKRAFGIAIFAFAFLLLAACPTGTENDPTDPTDPAAPTDPADPPIDPAVLETVVYIAGYYNDGSSDIPCYWKDEERVDLPYGTNVGGSASAIFVSGGKVYTAGSSDDGHDSNPCYWTGTTWTDLAGEGAEGISVAGGTVYTAVNGEWIDGATTAYGGAYYVDTVFNRLKGVDNPGVPARPERDTTANDIAVVDGTVYTAGRAAYDIDDSYACYWTGTDARTELDDSAEALAIFVSGGTVYTAGRSYGTGTSVPCYWTGTTITMLAGDGTHEAYAYDIQVAGGTVYTAGFYNDGSKDIACYWTGTTRTDLPGDGTNSAQAYGVSVFEGEVYTVGYYENGATEVPCYWKGTTKVDLSVGAGGYGYGLGIFIVKE